MVVELGWGKRSVIYFFGVRRRRTFLCWGRVGNGGSVLNLYNILYIIYIIILSIITSLFLVFFVALVISSELFFRNKFPNISFSSPWFKLFQKYSKKVLTYTVKVIYLNHTGGRKYETINNYNYRKRLDFK